jgi:hypothetical protein
MGSNGNEERRERERGGGWMATNEILEGSYWNPEDGGGGGQSQ